MPKLGYEDIIESLDSEQKKAVTGMENTVISAGAGSGKTKVLASRYVHLIVKEKIPVENILTLTFTQKATAEMYSRIYRTLENCREKEAEVAVKNFSQAKISTIDSFCASVSRDACAGFGVAPGFVIDDAKCRQLASKLALPFILERRKNRGLLNFLKKIPVRKLAEELFVEAACYPGLTSPIVYEKVLELQRNTLCAKINETIENIRDQIENIAIIPRNTGGASLSKALDIILEIKQHVYPEVRLSESDMSDMSSIGFLPQSEEYVFFRDKIHELSSVRKPGSNSKKEGDLLLRESLSALKGEGKEQGLISFFDVLNSGIETFPLVIEIFRLLKEFQQIYINEKRRSGVLSFKDSAVMALDGLINDPVLRKHYKTEIKAIMIDEFQDDNQLQRDLLFLLAEDENRMEKSVPTQRELCPRKLFFVGDEKQSIYKFRGADVSVFRQLTSDLIPESRRKSLPVLETNYRTEEVLLNLFNKIFPLVFSMGGEYIYEASFSGIKTKKNNPDVSPSMNITLIHKSLGEEKRKSYIKEAEASVVVDKIKKIVSEGIKVFDSDTCSLRPCSYKDIAVLFRKTTDLQYYEEELRKNNIPFITQNQRSLFLESPNNDIYHLLRLVVYPGDRLSYSVVLRSPFAGISDKGLALLMLEGLTTEGYLDSGKIQVPFSEEDLNLLPETDKPAFLCGKEIYDSVAAMTDRKNIGEVITYIWYNTGYRYSLVTNPDLQNYTELYDYLFEMARQADKENLQMTEFLDQLAEKVKSVNAKQDLSIPLENQSGVSLMSIHKSKGLEFPVVFISQCSESVVQDNNTDVVLFSKNNGITVNLPGNSGKDNWIFNLEKEENLRKEFAEIKRLLYVAMTRAESHLFLTGVVESPEDGDSETGNCNVLSKYESVVLPENKSRKGSFLELIIPAFKNLGQNEVNIEIIDSESKLPESFSGNRNVCNKNAGFSLLAKSYGSAELVLPVYKPVEIKAVTSLAEDAFATAENKGPVFDSKIRIENDFKVKSTDKHSTDNEEIEKILEEGGIGSTDLGTMVHNYIEFAIKQRRLASGAGYNILPQKIKDTIGKTKTIKLEGFIKELGEKFINSPLGDMEIRASWSYTEFPFYMRRRSGEEKGFSVVSGQMDLVFLTGDKSRIIVVDFKTDRDENPENHRIQVETYMEAAGKIWGIPVEGRLFYVRTGACYKLF